MSKVKFLAPLLLVFLLVGCILPPVMISPAQSVTGSGNLVTREFSIKDFDRLNISHAFKAEVTQGDGYAVQVTVDDNLEQYLEVSKQGDTLTVGLKPGLNLSLNRTTMRTKITMPKLRGIDANGATQVTLAGFESDDSLDVRVSGASTVRGDIQSGGSTFDVSGASTVRLNGRGGDSNIDVSGASRADLEDFVLEDVSIKVSGAGTAIVNVTGRLDAEASGASKVEYLGEPTLGNIDESGASHVAPR
jgi:hypothetical protein